MLTILSESWNDLQLIMNTFSSNFTGEGDYVASADRLLSLNSFVDLEAGPWLGVIYFQRSCDKAGT